MSDDWAMRAVLALSRELVLDIPDDHLEKAAEIIRSAAISAEPTNAFEVVADFFGMVKRS